MVYSEMRDTTKDMADFQYSLIMKMTPQQRFKMGLEMSDEGMKLMRVGILAEKGNLSDKEIRIEMIRRLKKYDPTLSWLNP